MAKWHRREALYCGLSKTAQTVVVKLLVVSVQACEHPKLRVQYPKQVNLCSFLTVAQACQLANLILMFSNGQMAYI